MTPGLGGGRLRPVDAVSRCGDVRNGRATGSGRSDPESGHCRADLEW